MQSKQHLSFKRTELERLCVFSALAFVVTQTFSLLYRRFSIGSAPALSGALEHRALSKLTRMRGQGCPHS
ncbi:MAG: hypothetical protein FJ403_03820 [Verrucomicrobia bacterium]|nr:hypothetical protein [Verrucomicrobiota bacterium]